MKQAHRKKQDLIARRKWIKLYPMECLNGSIRYQLTSEQRGTWYDLLNFSAICTNHGVISDRDGRPYPHDFIANRLNIPIELLESTLKNCLEEGRVTENETGIHITNWKLYQSEYDRQKPYRQQREASLPEPTDFDQFVEEMRKAYPALDIDAELIKFNLYWSEGKRKLQRPKLALKNWLERTGKYPNKTKPALTKPITPPVRKFTEHPGPPTAEERAEYWNPKHLPVLTDEQGERYYIDPGSGMKTY